MLDKVRVFRYKPCLAIPAAYVAVGLVVFWASGERAKAQNPPFSSGSTDHEGALNIIAPGETIFDPVAMKLNPVVPGIFNFKTINIAAGSTLKFTEEKYHGPVYFLASGDVTISGSMDLSGENSEGPISFGSQRMPNTAGSGGFSGGIGGFDANRPPLDGNGPGKGAKSTNINNCGSGGTNTSNQFLVPIIGGSGGGGYLPNGTIGGAGGGALLIASSTIVTINGSIKATGGHGAQGGAGAGGAVRIIASTIQGSGSINVSGGSGGCSGTSNGGHGLARFESNNLGGVSVNGPTTRSPPFALNLPTTGAPSIRVTSINGQPINSNPSSFPDIPINSTAPVPIVVQAHNVPVGTVATIYLFFETGPDQVVKTGPLMGTPALSTATANITYPPGGTRGFVKAIW